MKILGNKKDRDNQENYLETNELASVPSIEKNLDIFRINEDLESMRTKIETTFKFDEEKQLIYLESVLASEVEGIPTYREYIEDGPGFIDDAADAYYEDKEFKDIKTVQDLLKKTYLNLSNDLIAANLLINGDYDSTIYVMEDNTPIGIIDGYNLSISDYEITVDLGNFVSILPVNETDYSKSTLQLVFGDKCIEAEIDDIQKQQKSFTFEITDIRVIDEDKRLKPKSEFTDREEWRMDRIRLLNSNIQQAEASFDLEDLFD